MNIYIFIATLVRCRQAAGVKRPSTSTTTTPTTTSSRPPDAVLSDNEALSSLLTHLSRSIAATSRDCAHSVATVNGARYNDSCLGSVDCSVVSAPADCQVCALGHSFGPHSRSHRSR